MSTEPEDNVAFTGDAGDAIAKADSTRSVKAEIQAAQDRRAPMTQERLYKDSGFFWSDIARSPRFEQLTLLVIAINSVWISIDVDKNKAKNLLEADAIFIFADFAFCIFFSLEWGVRFLAFRQKSYALRDAWFMFDSVLVFFMVLETWVMTFVVALFDASGTDELGSLTILRLLRLARLGRLTRLMRALPEMMIILKGLASALRSVVVTLMMMAIMVYVFSIAFVQLMENTSTGEDMFGTVPSGMYTLMVDGIIPDQGGLLNVLAEEGWGLGAMFVFFVSLTTLAMMNMLIGIICEVAARISNSEKERMDVDFITGKLEHIVATQVDSNGDKMIDKDEFLNVLKCEEAIKALWHVGCDVLALVDRADVLFDYFDDSGQIQEKKMTFDDFMHVVLELRGVSAASAQDVHKLRHMVQDGVAGLERRLHTGLKDKKTRGPAQVLQEAAIKAEVIDQEREKDNAPTIKPQDLQVLKELAQLPEQVQDIAVRTNRLENLMQQIVSNQWQMQTFLAERLPPSSQQKELLRSASLLPIERGGVAPSFTGGPPPDAQSSTSPTTSNWQQSRLADNCAYNPFSGGCNDVQMSQPTPVQNLGPHYKTSRGVDSGKRPGRP